MSVFGSELKRLASERGLSQKKIADACGVDQTFVGKLMRGDQAAPRADVLYKLCDALGVTVEHFRPFLASNAPEPSPKKRK